MVLIPMTELPSMIFSSDAVMTSEHLVLASMPDFCSSHDLEAAFLASLALGDAAAFAEFCASDVADFRIFHLINLYPYHFAFAEKCRIGGEIQNIVFLAEDASPLHSLMSPASESLRDMANDLINELSNGDANSNKLKYITPESLLALSHIPNFTAILRADAGEPIYCDLHKLIDCVCTSFSGVEFYSDINFIRTENRGTDLIVELSRTPFVYVLSSVFAVLHAVSGDRSIRIDAHKFSYAGEITLTASTAQTDKLPFTCTALSDIASVFPSVSAIARSAEVLSLFSDLILSIDVDRELDTVRVTLGVGFDYQSEPDFKFSDPYSDLERIVKDVLDVFELIK